MQETSDFSCMVLPLLSWYRRNRKELPWRKDNDAYHIWLSEIMLQQTRWTAVIPYYERFLDEFPSIGALASADPERLMKLWEGLGYYSRARNLLRTAKIVTDSFDGVFPRQASELEKLPGIGAYTAGAIASIAFGEATPAVDGNVLRVTMRYQNCEEDIADPRVKKTVASALSAVYPKGDDAGLFTQALMELGEEICIPNGAPRCTDCPLRTLCKARQFGRERELPKKSPKKGRKIEKRTVFLLSCRGEYAITKRAETGLLAGLWEFPNTKGSLTVEQASEHLRALGLQTLALSPCGDATHIFTHVEWHMTGYLAECVYPSEQFVFAGADKILKEYAIPTAFRAYLDAMCRDAGK